MDSLLSPEGTYAGRTRTMITISYFGCFGSIGVCLASLGPILLTLSQQLDVSLDTLGALFVARSVGYLLGAGLSGYLVDRLHHTHAMLLVTMLSCAVGTLLVPILNTFAFVAAAFSTQGICMGVLDTGGNVLLIWLHGSGRVEPYMQAMHCCFGLGAFIGPLLVELSVQQTGGFSASFFLISATMVLWSVPLSFHRGPRKPAPPSDSAKACRDSSANEGPQPPSRQVELSVVTAPDLEAKEGTTHSQPTEVVHTVEESDARSRATYWFVGLSALVLLIYVGAEVAFGGYIFAYSVKALNMSEPEARLINSSFWGWLTIGRLLAVPASTRLSPAVMLAGCASGSALSAFAFRLSSLPWVATGAFGLFMAPIFPCVITNAERVISVTGRMTSCFVASAAFGEMLLPFVVAQCFRISYSSFPDAICIFSVCQFIAFVSSHQAALHILRGRSRSSTSQSVTCTHDSSHISDSFDNQPKM